MACLALAGCSSAILGTGPSVSNPQVSVVNDGGAAVAFNYSVGDYATAILEGPSGEVLGSKRIGPDNDHTQLGVSRLQGGEYTIALQQGGETQTTTTMDFAGPAPTIQSVNANWTGTTAQSITATVANTGNLPVEIRSAAVTVRNDTMSSPNVFQWVDAGETATVSIEGTFGQSISIDEPSDVRGQVRLGTTAGNLTDEFTHSFTGPSVAIADVTPHWDSNSLSRVEVSVQNTGDMATEVTPAIRRADEELASTRGETVGAGETAQFTIDSFASIYQAESSGKVSLQVVADSPAGFDSTTIERDVEAATLSLTEIDPAWDAGTLSHTFYTVTNDGDVAAEFTTTVRVDGGTVWTGDERVAAESTAEFSTPTGPLAEALYTASEGGTYEVTVAIEGPSRTASQSAMHEIAAPEASIDVSDSLFMETLNRDDVQVQLSSLTLDIQNSGKTAFTYDEVAITIDGIERTDEPATDRTLSPGESVTNWVTLSDEVTVDSGEYSVTIELLSDGEVIASDTATVTAETSG